jgi:hypothetical protein
LGGAVPKNQAKFFRHLDGGVDHRLFDALEDAGAKINVSRTPGRLYLYFSGYTLGHGPSGIVLLTDGERQVSIDDIVESIRRSSTFREVLLFIDGWEPPSELEIASLPALRPMTIQDWPEQNCSAWARLNRRQAQD